MSQPLADVGSIVIVEDEPVVRRLMRLWLEADGYRVVEYGTGREAIEHDTRGTAIVCLDLRLEDMQGLSVLQQLHARDPDLPVIMVTGDQDVDTAVEAMRAGAYDYMTKPFDRERLAIAVGRAVERRQLTSSVRRLREELEVRSALSSLIGATAPMRELTAQVERAIGGDAAVTLLGESGTGKELVARAIHSGSRRQGPLVTVNCAAIPEVLQESEIFGHEGVAHRGRFEEASGGTLFLDEVADLGLAAQGSLMRALREKTIRPVGGSAEIPVDARVLCATRRELEAEVRAGRFREDLCARLLLHPIRLPPLRARRDDIPLLSAHFMRLLRADVGRDIERIEPAALDVLMRYAWPGNVRELMNVVHRAMLACDGEVVTLAHLPKSLKAPAAPEDAGEASAAKALAGDGGALFDGSTLNLRELEQRAIARALEVSGGSVGKAAKLLGIGRATLYRRLSGQREPLSGGGEEMDGRESARP